ncbi:MAG: translation initiation factor IF-2, partial [Proteobacteria bacterium]
MSKIRVYELARELKIESKLLVNKLKDLGIEVSSHQSTLSADQVVKIKRELSSSASGGASSAAESSTASAPRSNPSVIRRRQRAEESADGEDGGGQDEKAAPQAEAASTKEAAPAATTSKTTTIRREKAREPEVAKEKAPETQAQTTAPAQEVVQTQAIAQPDAPQVEAKAEAPAKIEQAQDVSVSQEPKAKEPVPQVARETQKPISSPASEPRTMPRPQAQSQAQAQENYDSAKIVRREPLSQSGGSQSSAASASAAPAVSRPQPSGAATIIRRASPEEMEQRASMSREAPARATVTPGGGGMIIRPNVGGAPAGFPSGGGPIRREGGGGPGAPRPGFPSAGGPRGGSGSEPLYSRKPPTLDTEAPSGLTDAPARRWEDVTKSKDRDKRKLTAAEAELEAAAAAKKLQKTRRDQVNMRSLLDQAASLEEEVGDLEAEAPLEPAPQIKKTVYTPPGGGNHSSGGYRGGSGRRDLKRRKDLKKTEVTMPRAAYRVVKMGNSITVAELAKQMSVKGSDIIKKLMQQGVMATLNQSIDVDTATLLATDFGFEMKTSLVTIDDILSDKRKAHEGAEFGERAPIVTIMGHVDHGKTSILDAIRQAKVAAGEAGGITQHIGAYTVDKDGKKIAFLDTPGHEAFSAMRSRGAKATDIVVLVVAADDGVMPQTVEAISHARAAGVPIIVAINKIDKPNKNLDRINSELAEHGIQSEEWGGDNQFVQVSALKGIGIDNLLEAILLQAEVLELKTPLDVPASGVVVEAHLDKGRGPVATIMVQKGILKVGDFVVAGTALGRVRAMHDQSGKRVKEAGPSTPVEVVGLASVPMAGDTVDAVGDEKQAKDVADWRIETERMSMSNRSSAATL